MTKETQADIDAALEETKDVVCIQLYAAAKSPHENYIYETNPCVQAALISRGWTTPTPEETVAFLKPNA